MVHHSAGGDWGSDAGNDFRAIGREAGPVWSVYECVGVADEISGGGWWLSRVLPRGPAIRREAYSPFQFTINVTVVLPCRLAVLSVPVTVMV